MNILLIIILICNTISAVAIIKFVTYSNQSLKNIEKLLKRENQ